MRAAILLLRFSRVSAFLRLERGESAASVGADTAMAAGRVGWAVRAAAARVPWQSTCLVQATTGAYLLRRRRLPCTLYLGVAKDEAAAEGIAAHAWLRCGEAILTGDCGRERFRTIAALTPRLAEPRAG